ncbi:MAG: Abi family protein [Hymenobacter sp.]|nr:MAG: Abi family protein [Hymenobacter sp.]
MRYTKPALSLPQQVALLQSRGLLIEDSAQAERDLARLSYYRLAAYFLAFQTPGDPTHHFRAGTTFAQTVRLYEFDEALRFLVFRATGVIEVALRAQLSYHNSLLLGPHWYENQAACINAGRFQSNLVELDKELSRAHEIFLDHYRATYNSPVRPPSWMALEVASFGLTSKLFNNLRSSNATKGMGRFFGVDEIVLRSWMRMMSYVRNVCAHHSRLWNRTLTVKPTLPRRTANQWLQTNAVADDRIYIVLVIAVYLQSAMSNDTGRKFKDSVKELLRQNPTVPTQVMGFPVGWEQEAFWQ